MKTALPWLLAALSGLALALAMPGPGISPLALLFPGLLLEALHRVEGRWKPWFLGWLAGTVFWVVTANWVVAVMHHYGGLSQFLAVGCLIGMGAYLGILWAMAAAVTAVVPKRSRIWLFPAAWIAITVLQRFQPYGFAWTGVASAFVDWPWLMQSLPVWGATGLGWSVAAAGAGAWGLARSGSRNAGGLAIATAGVALAAAVAVSPLPVNGGPEMAVAVVQPGTTLEEKWDPSQGREIADRVWSMTAEAALLGADLVLWPEGAMPFSIENDPNYRETVENFAREFDIEIVLNSIAPVVGGAYANSAYLVTPEGLSPVRYDKVQLVPFGEYVPAWARLAFTESLVREVGAFTPGSVPVVLPASVPLGVAICFEVVFPDLVAREVRGGAQVLATLTNDGWYGFSWAPLQHFAQVRLRAAENRRWFARAALTGISGFVDPTGRVTSYLEVGQSGVLVETVQPMRGLTLRARWGDWWALLCAVGALVAVVWSRRPAALGSQRSNTARSKR
jgi:apolipoprotein N-acyltransferase